MKKIFLYLAFSLIILGCGGDKQKSEISKKTVVNDTIVYEYNFVEEIKPIEIKDTILQINNESFVLEYSAKLDREKKYFYTDKYSYESKNHKDIYKGFNATYPISLKNKSGKIIFSKTLTKDNFKAFFDRSILTRSDARIPDFIGYLPTFDSYLFRIDFWVPDSDVGGQCFFMINNKGEITENSLNNYFGGSDCAGEVEIPTSQKFILTCRKILNSNGKKVDITNKNLIQIGTKLINDDTILVIHEFNDSIKNSNAKLIDNLGKTLKSFKYQGYYEVLGYNVPIHFDDITNNYFLLDEDQKNIRIINKLNPLSTYTVDFAKMEKFDGTKEESEIVFNLNTETTENTFSFNPITKLFKHK